MMKYVRKLEAMAEDWLKKVPHLPKNGQKWLAENVWWIALIGAIAYGISIIVGLSTLAVLVAPPAYYAYYVAGPVFSGWAIVTTTIGLLFNLLAGLLLAISVSPLKEMTKKGWTVLFMLLLVNAVALVVTTLLNLIGNFGILAFVGVLFSLVFGAIFLSIAAYFLFEIRSYFAHTTKGAKKK